MSKTLRVISSVDGSIYYECPMHRPGDIEKALGKAVNARKEWKLIPVSERKKYIGQFVEVFERDRQRISP